MTPQVDRRRFLQATGMFVAATAAPSLGAAPAAAPRIRKAVGWAMVQEKLSVEDKVRVVKDAGFEGIEVNAMLKDEDPKELARASQKVGVPVHGVSGGTGDLKGAIDQAAVYGADTVLYVVRADPKAPYMETYRASQAVIRECIPQAEKKKIRILIENVWATFLIDPMGMARYIDELGSPWVQSYFDIGNVMRWGWPQHWIEILGKRIVKIHIKEYSLKIGMKEGMSKGFDLPIGQGDIDWARVMEELRKIDFRNWATAEVRGGDRQRLAEIAQQMDKVLAM